MILTVLSLFSSNDPIAKRIWGTEDVMGKNIYALRYHLAGNDGITYNIEYLQIANIRSNLIIQANASKSPVHINNCYWIFPDPNNEYKMIKILNLNTQLSCIY